MKEKNKKLIIVVSLLLVLVASISLAYFVTNILINGEGSSAEVTTAKLKDTTFTIEGNLEFEDLDILPGHKNVSKIKLTAKNNNDLINYNLIWNGTNGLSTPLKYYVYKSSSSETPSITCTKKEEVMGAYKVLYETCIDNNFDNLGEVIASGTITNSSDEKRKIVLKENEAITSSEEGTVVYYYVVLEYPNEDNSQSGDMNKEFNGIVTVELAGETVCGTHNVNTILGTLAVNDCEPDFAKTSQEADNAGKVCMYKENSVAALSGSPTEESCQQVFKMSGLGYVDNSLLQMFQKEEGVGTWNSETSTCTYYGNTVGVYPSENPTEEQCKKNVYFYSAVNMYWAGIEEVGAGEWSDTEKTCTYNGNAVEPVLGDEVTEETCQHIFYAPGVGYADGSLLWVAQKVDGVGTWNSETSTCTYNGNIVTLPDESTPTEEQCKKSIYHYHDGDNYAVGIEEVGAGEWTDAIIGKTGIYEAPDGMYGGTSYYFRGAATNNYLTFAGFCWRIVRINGDGTIRLIYDGSSCHANGTETDENIAVKSVQYNTKRDRSEYVGWTYKEGYQRPSDTTEGEEIDSNIKTVTEEWYNTNIGNNPEYANKVADSKFCNDREVAEGYTWESQPSSKFYYAADKRLFMGNKPTLNCSNKNDIYNLKVGLLTADEVTYAGRGGGEQNISYYLYNKQWYYLASPYNLDWYGSARWANMFLVGNDGRLRYDNVSGANDVRPVISLRSDITISGGTGTIDNPYVVS